MPEKQVQLIQLQDNVTKFEASSNTIFEPLTPLISNFKNFTKRLDQLKTIFLEKLRKISTDIQNRLAFDIKLNKMVDYLRNTQKMNNELTKDGDVHKQLLRLEVKKKRLSI